MITNKELSEVSLSPTKKDYYQIWNELLELASRLSNRWSPDSTNESDPGIVLLKSLVAIADKLNYNIDKNTLEAFMPSATQMESMRKLTEMMGYSMKYYRAATCKVDITFNNPDNLSSYQILFPKFTNLKNEEEDINYVTLEDFVLQEEVPSRQINVMEGELIECETNTDNVIYLTHLDDNHRYILPETNVAENGIFIFNIADKDTGSEESEPWKQVDNLNTQLPGACVFKFGFDSSISMPYVQFPDDISQIIKDGIRIRYIRTNGLSGNIARGILCKLEVPSIWSSAEEDYIKSLASEQFTVNNTSAATNGANPESLNSAYNNYKKTVGTFDTLITCRDYMNKIYQLTVSDTDTTPLVSNAIVADIRDDINRSVNICSFNEYGISYTDVALPANDIDHFELMLYPFKTVYGLNTKDEFKNSFTYNAENFARINYDIKNNKTIAHTLKLPDPDDIALIKNYFRLKATITTNKKVTNEEAKAILANIYAAIYENFNMRKLDFGEKLSREVIEEVMENADPRIKDINLDEPLVYTKFLTADNSEYDLVASDTGAIAGDLDIGSQLYNKLVIRNILAGRIAAFQYDTDFKVDYSEMTYPTGTDEEGNDVPAYSTNYPLPNTTIVRMKSEFTPESTSNLKLKENEVIQFRMPNLKTTTTYPSYVNYFIKLNVPTSARYAIPATFMTLRDFMNETVNDNSRWSIFVNDQNYVSDLTYVEITSAANFVTKETEYGAIFIKDANEHFIKVTSADFNPNESYYVFEINDLTYGKLNSYIEVATQKTNTEDTNSPIYGSLYRSCGADISRNYGRLIDEDLVKYTKANTAKELKFLYVPITHATDDQDVISHMYTADGLGQDADYPAIPVDGEYELKPSEYLLVNYTDSKSGDNGSEQKSVISLWYGPGTIIKPNFALTDSTLYHNNHSWSKTTGFGPFKHWKTGTDALTGIPNFSLPAGMFTLSTNEQICIREIVKVTLDKAGTYLYWIRKDDDKEATKNYFTFPERYRGVDKCAYTLKEGEYLFYTNSKKTDLAYYGSGTLIVKGAGISDRTISKDTADGELDEEKILEFGLTGAIPWPRRAITFNEDTCNLDIIENQYITLTEGDTLINLSHTGQDSNIVDLHLTNRWSEELVQSATYKLAESNSIEPLPTIDITGLGWRARSRLNFNMGPTKAQTLNEYDRITIYFKQNHSTTEQHLDLKPVYIEQIDSTTNETKNVIQPLSIYSNYPCMSSSDEIDVTTANEAFKDLGLGDDYTFKLKLALLKTPTLNENGEEGTTNILLDNYINENTTYTKFSFEDSLATDADQPAAVLNINIPDGDKYGLVMFYYVDENIDNPGHSKARIRARDANGDTYTGLHLFNNDDITAYSTITLNSGMQIIKLDKTIRKLELLGDIDNDADKSNKSIVIFSDISLIKDINPKLNFRYNSTLSASALDQLLLAIKETDVADNFYYNNPVSNSNAIDLNPLITSDTLASADTWYDSNNTANKFVISEIDWEYLNTGIAFSKSSRL